MRPLHMLRTATAIGCSKIFMVGQVFFGFLLSAGGQRPKHLYRGPKFLILVARGAVLLRHLMCVTRFARLRYLWVRLRAPDARSCGTVQQLLVRPLHMLRTATAIGCSKFFMVGQVFFGFLLSAGGQRPKHLYRGRNFGMLRRVMCTGEAPCARVAYCMGCIGSSLAFSVSVAPGLLARSLGRCAG